MGNNGIIQIEVKGDDKVEKRLKSMALRMKYAPLIAKLQHAGEQGVKALQDATPKLTGFTAASWEYVITVDDTGAVLRFRNTNVVNGWFNVALSLQYGHGTKNGGWVEGIDYINPALRPIFEKMSLELREEVFGGGH